MSSGYWRPAAKLAGASGSSAASASSTIRKGLRSRESEPGVFNQPSDVVRIFTLGRRGEPDQVRLFAQMFTRFKEPLADLVRRYSQACRDHRHALELMLAKHQAVQLDREQFMYLSWPRA